MGSVHSVSQDIMPNYRITTTAIVAVEVAPTTTVHITYRTNGGGRPGAEKRVPLHMVALVKVNMRALVGTLRHLMVHIPASIAISVVKKQVLLAVAPFFITVETVKILIFTIYKYQTIRI